MNERNLQQHQQNDLVYSPISPYWTTTTAPVLRSPWSAPSLKQSPHYGNRNSGQLRNKSQSSSHYMDYDDESLHREHQTTIHSANLSSGMRNHCHYSNQRHQQDNGKSAHVLDTHSAYLRPVIYSQQYQQPLYDVEQPYIRHRRTSLSSYTDRNTFSAPSTNSYNTKNLDRLVAIENSGIDQQNHYIAPNNDRGHVQRRLRQSQQQIAPTLIANMETNKRSSSHRQEPAHLGHHHYAAHSGWKISSQCNYPSPRSSLSPTPPFLYDTTSNSSSATSYTTLSSSSSAAPIPASTENLYFRHHHHRRNSNDIANISGTPNHRRNSSIDGSCQIVDYPHRQKQPILASSTTTTETSSLSSPSIPANYSYPTTSVKPTSANSIKARYRHSYSDCHDDQQQNPCQNVPIERTRRSSQSDFTSSNNRQQQTAVSSVNPTITNHASIPRRASTPKLRRVCSAKPYMEQPFPPSLGNKKINGDSDNDNDLLSTTMDAASLSLAKCQLPAFNDDLGDDGDGAIPLVNEQQASPTFWNPRSEKDIIPVKRTLSRRIRGLLLPQRNKLDVTVSKEQQMESDYQWSLARPLTPANELSFDSDVLLEDHENGVSNNPFYIISQSWESADCIGLSFDEDDFISVDTYASGLQQMDPSLTPQILSKQLLTRPYRRDLYRLRTLFTWIIQNISIVGQCQSVAKAGGQQVDSNDNDNDGEATTAAATTGSTTIVTNTIQPSKISLRQRLTTRRNASTSDQAEELEMPSVDVMHGDGLLPEGGGNIESVESFDDWLFSESAQQVLLHRGCSSSIGMANLFYEMATAAGYRDVRVVYGYLRAPKDSLSTACMDDSNEEINVEVGDNDNVTLIQNHAWCCVKVEGEYRFVDCWLASPFQPQNKNKIEPHWFLTKPIDLIYTHFPQESADQCLEPTIQVTTFFALPYVWAPFFTHHIKMIRYNPNAITLVDDQVCHLVFRMDRHASCFAFVETTEPLHSSTDESATATVPPTATTTTLTIMRCLTQSRMVTDENGSPERIYKIKAVLPPGHDTGWLKIYAGHSSFSPLTTNGCISSSGAFSTRQGYHHGASSNSNSNSHNSHNSHNNNSNGSSMVSLELPPLALCFRLTVQQQAHHLSGGGGLRPFEFVHLHPCRHEFYIREPQCYQLYPSHTYNFFIRGDDMHHKLAIKSPGGKLYKLMYYPQEHTYDGSVKIAEIGKWSLVSLSNHAGGWSVVATWECRV